MSAKARALHNKVNNLLNDLEYEKLKSLLSKNLSECRSEEIPDPFCLVEIAGAYITLGSESYNKESVEIGMKLFEEFRDAFKGNITESSIEYCLANGHHALYKISVKDQPWVIYPESVKGHLFEAKQCYLKAFKMLDLSNLDNFSIQVMTNLGNNLNHSGRLVESLQLFDSVLSYNPNFPEALISKASSLAFFVRNTQYYSISLFAEMYRLFNAGLNEEPNFPHDVLDSINRDLQACTNFLHDQGFDFSTTEQEFALNEEEYDKHSSELKFYLDNFLGLSEHSLFCKCNEAKIDNLSIGQEGSVVTKKVAELEHLLNRMKSEFSFARRQLYEHSLDPIDDHVYFQDFGTHSMLYGIHNEKLRIAFRMCFGIFDKIAQGILHLYDLEKGNNENTYFESFWRNPNAPAERWEKFNDVKNTHLTALYSIACDLSKHNGEFSFYKEWRNKLEHDIFSVLPDGTESDIILESPILSSYTTESNFQEKALHLLQLVRAAIFSFTFCCRTELILKES